MRRSLKVIGALALLVAACGGSSTGGVATLEAQTDAVVEDIEEAASLTDEEALLGFAACMRDNGVADFPDPTVNADGSVEFGFGARAQGADGGQLGETDPETVQAAFQACTEHLAGLAFGPGAADFDAAEFQDTFVEFAACMREHGVEMDDPDFSNFGPGRGGGGDDAPGGGGPFVQLDPDDPDVQAALEACRDIFSGFRAGARIGSSGGGNNGGDS